MRPRRIIIMGAAGRDFHNFNTYYRSNPRLRVVAFTAAQIPKISGRTYPAVLAGRLYPKGIPIFPEDKLPELIEKYRIDEVVFSYSDISFDTVMHKASQVIACGADFKLLGSKSTMLRSKKPVISVCAVRTGSGKSQTSRKIASILKEMGKRVVVVRHPMPYGNLTRQICQRFAWIEDMDRHNCTIEEREEYEHHIRQGTVVFAGVDYQVILNQAEKEADVILWDGGNNDLPFFAPDLHITVADPHRPGHEQSHHPGEANVRMADIVIINKVETADPKNVRQVKKNILKLNPDCKIVEAYSPVAVGDPRRIRGRAVLAIEDGPTLTHGDMKYGAAYIAARKFGARKIVDPRPYAVGSIKNTYKKFPHLVNVLPAMGYGKNQIRELNQTINAVPCDLVLVGTPADLPRLLKISKPSMQVTYSLKEKGKPVLKKLVEENLSGL